MHARYFGDNVVFFGLTRFIHPAPATRGSDGMIDCIAVTLTITVNDDSPLYRV